MNGCLIRCGCKFQTRSKSVNKHRNYEWNSRIWCRKPPQTSENRDTEKRFLVGQPPQFTLRKSFPRSKPWSYVNWASYHQIWAKSDGKHENFERNGWIQCRKSNQMSDNRHTKRHLFGRSTTSVHCPEVISEVESRIWGQISEIRVWKKFREKLEKSSKKCWKKKFEKKLGKSSEKSWRKTGKKSFWLVLEWVTLWKPGHRQNIHFSWTYWIAEKHFFRAKIV